ncbi:MAG: NAD-dependent epimerase [Geminocystis sp.]|nr:NAD-dependent epimerase [Geminocystis sp.]
METILVTGSSGFIGYHLSKRLLTCGFQVLGLDNMNDYYDVSLKQARLRELQKYNNFQFHQLDLCNRQGVMDLFASHTISKVVHLAAQAGVRYSLENPYAYIDSNIVGFINILEACRHHPVQHLVYASSSSVYGNNQKVPFSVTDNVDYPISLYAATKRANELMAYTYSHLYQIPTTGLRFFTVYGSWGRPDMAYFIFTKNILEGKPIKIFNYGHMKRDFTYVDDIIEGVVRVMHKIPQPSPDNPQQKAPHRLYNIGNNQPVELLELVACLEKCLGIEAKKEFLPMQPGDVVITYADIDDLYQAVGFKPSTPLAEGIAEFVRWYRDFYNC